MLDLLDERGAAYPAEHNVGHVYTAPANLAAHYAALDPTNSFNAGIGKASRLTHYGQNCWCSNGFLKTSEITKVRDVSPKAGQ